MAPLPTILLIYPICILRFRLDYWINYSILFKTVIKYFYKNKEFINNYLNLFMNDM